MKNISAKAVVYEYILYARGVVSRPTVLRQFALWHSKEVGDLKKSFSLPDSDKPPLLSERSERKWG